MASQDTLLGIVGLADSGMDLMCTILVLQLLPRVGYVEWLELIVV